MTKIKEIKIAMVGAGFAANIHAEAYKKVVGFDVKVVAIAVAPSDVDMAKEFCKKHGFDAKIYTNADKMIEEVDADVIDLVVPTFLHVKFAIKAAQCGKHVICEKPLTGYFGDPNISIEERTNVGATDKKLMLKEVLKQCKEIEEVFKKYGKKFCYAENWCYAPPISKAKRMVKAAKGKILEIRCGESHSGSHSKFAAEWKYTGGGSLLRMMAHPLSAALHLKMWEGMWRDGKPIYPKSVICTTTKCRDFLKDLPRDEDYIVSRPVDVEDWACVIITFEDTTNAVCIGSDVTLGGIENWLNIYASTCRIETKISNNNTVMSYAPTAKQFEKEYTIEKTETKCGWNFSQPDEDWMTGYPFEMQDFFECITSGDEKKPVSDLDLAIWSAKTMYASYLSAEKGIRVEIPKDYNI
ncbi:MAG: Gfo/Idh/MocA family protein [Promethearchaeota archaeon]